VALVVVVDGGGGDVVVVVVGGGTKIWRNRCKELHGRNPEQK
jgi:hypothetical protein